MAEMAVRPLESGTRRPPVAIQALGPLAFATVGAEATSFPRDLVRLCTAHDSRIQTDKAYQRSDLPAKRREIMQGWSDFVVSTS
jgi:hypothetical protein